MHLDIAEHVFDPEKLASCARTIMSIGDLPDKIPLRSLVFAKDRELSAIGRFLVLHFWDSAIPERYKAATGDDPLLLLHSCTLRFQSPDAQRRSSPWQLDAHFYGFDVPVWTLWAPCIDADGETGGLEFSLREDEQANDAHVRAFWHQVMPDEHGQAMITDPERAAFHDSDRYRTMARALRVGDAFVFDQHVLHRPRRLAEATTSRLALEYRVASVSRFPRDVEFARKKEILVAVRASDGTVTIKKVKEHFAASDRS